MMYNVTLGGVPVWKKTQYQECHKITTDEGNHTINHTIQSLCAWPEFESLEFQYDSFDDMSALQTYASVQSPKPPL
jgi:hypothetical protein